MKSLFSKTLLVMVLLFGVIASGASLLSAFELRGHLLDEYRSKAAALVTNIADSDVDLVINRDLARLQSTLDQYLMTPGVAYVLVEDESGEIIAHTFVPAVPAGVRPERASRAGVSFHEIEVEGFGSVLQVSAPILEGVAGFAHVGMDLGSVQRRIWRAILRVQLLVLGIFAVSVLAAVALVRRISGPLRDFAGYARRLGRIDEDDLERTETTIRTTALQQRDEIGVLARSFVDMEHQLRDSVRRLRETTAAKERMESELKIARDIQRNILPKGLDAGEVSGRIDLDARMTPALDVGGDFYDFFPTASNLLYFAVGDVSGKGVPASLFMAVTATLLRATAHDSDDPAEVLTRVNRELCRRNESMMFVTVFLGVLDLATGEVRYCNGGHNPPYVLSSSGARELIEGTGILLGCFEEVEYTPHRLRLERGDGLFLFTDGVTEAWSSGKEMFGDQRLAAVLGKANGAGSAEVATNVAKAVATFAAGAPPSDDITILSIRYLGGGGVDA